MTVLSLRGGRDQRQRRDLPDGTTLRWPGAEGKFALFAEVLWIGVLTVAGGLLVITLPAALAASTRHLHRYLRADRSTIGQWWSDFGAALRTGWIVGLTTTAAAAVLSFNLLLAGTRVLPGWQVVVAGGALAGVLVALILLQSAARWSPEHGWRQALRDGARSLITDPGAIIQLVLALLLTSIVTWQLLPLLVPGLGCLVFAVLAVKERERPAK